MVSEMAMEDVEALRADGVDVTPRDVVRLNALGLRVERSSRSSEFHVLPRVAFVGDAILREPTLEQEAWMCLSDKSFDGRDVDTVILLRALCLSTAPSELPSATDPHAVMDAITRMQAGPLKTATIRQLVNGIDYALRGACPTSDELGPERPAKDEDVEDEDGDIPQAGVVCEGVVYRLGSVSELMRYTASQLDALVLYNRELKYGESARKGQHGRALGEYLAVVDEIRERSKNGE